MNVECMCNQSHEGQKRQFERNFHSKDLTRLAILFLAS